MHTNHLKPHSKLTITTCDAALEADLVNLFRGQDVVASFIGHVKGSPENIQSIAIQNAIKAMHQAGIARIVSLTGTGVRSPGDQIPIVDRIVNLGLLATNPTRLWDGKKHAALLQASDLDWTIIRVLRLKDGDAQPFELREHGPTKLYVSREEVAQATLQVLQNHTFTRQMPIICN
jgi:putative NADH-flavin reductase